jgi:hypothetical protein
MSKINTTSEANSSSSSSSKGVFRCNLHYLHYYLSGNSLLQLRASLFFHSLGSHVHSAIPQGNSCTLIKNRKLGEKETWLLFSPFCFPMKYLHRLIYALWVHLYLYLYLISSHLISSHLISLHLISLHLI